MATNAAGIIFSNLNTNTLSRLTGDRTVAAIPFACRYRLIDFCLSDLVNAEISNISIVANYQYNSLVEHIGSGIDWDMARRKGGIKLITPFSMGGSGAKMYSTHMEALKSIKPYILAMKEEYVVIMDSDNIMNINLKDVIRAHQKSDASMTVITRPVSPDYSSKHPRMMMSTVAGKVTDIAMSNSYMQNCPELFLATCVMKREILLRLIEEAEAYNLDSLTDMMLKDFKHMNIHAYSYNGYAASVSSFLDYYRASIELTKNEKARESLLWKADAPIFTRVHNSTPTRFAEGSHVEDSMIADDCEIEGTVIHSVISRGVKIEKGAVVKECVLFRGTTVGKNASLTSIVTDKDVTISDGVVLAGTSDMPFYVRKGRKV